MERHNLDALKTFFLIVLIASAGYFVVNQMRDPGFLAQVFTFKGRSYVFKGETSLPQSSAHDFLNIVYTSDQIAVATKTYSTAKDKNGNDQDLLLDIYAGTPLVGGVKAGGSGTVQLRPVAVYVNGGAFCNASRLAPGAITWTRDWFAVRDWVGVSIDYRQRCPGSDPTATGIAQKETAADIMSAVRYMRSPEIRAAYNIDPNRIILVGSSAGAIGILMADMSSEIAGDFVNQSGFKNVYDNTANHPLPSDANYIPSWVCFAISEAGSVTGGYMTNWLDVAHDAPAIDIHSVDDTTILYSEAVNTMQNFSTKGILPILTTSNIIDAFTSANLALPIAPANLIIITDPDGTKLTHGEYFKADDKVQSVLFPILYTNVITAPCPTGQMTVPAII